MPRLRLSSHWMTLPARILLRLWTFLASLELAVFVIAASAVVLAWATRVEGRYGAEGAGFGIYGSWWYAGLLGLLGVNVLAAALIRFPWKKKQTGFVITHAGILVLLAGCWLSRQGGVDAQLPLFEGGTGSVAYEDTQHFRLAIFPQSRPESAGRPAAEVIEVPFAAGPFNWADYQQRLSWFPWKLAHRDRGVIYDRDGVRLEVLDYYSDSQEGVAPPVELLVESRSAGEKSQPETVELDVRLAPDPNSPEGCVALGSRRRLAGGGRITFRVAGSEAETAAFLRSGPQGPLGEKGQIVLFARDSVFRMPVESLEDGRRRPLGSTGLEVALDHVDRQFAGVILWIHGGAAAPERMVLLADFPEFNHQAPEHGVFGSYWLDASEPPGDQGEPPDPGSPPTYAHEPRIDLMQGADGRLYFRTWKPPDFGTAGPLATDAPVTVPLPGGQATLVLAVRKFVVHDAPGRVIEPLPFTKRHKKSLPKQPRARLRLTVDGRGEEFWLEGMGADPLHEGPHAGQRRAVHGDRRAVEVQLRKDEIDVGFTLYLHDFRRKLDPGTSMASHYSSLVDLCDHDDPEKVIEEKVLITLNEPVNFSDPKTGRSYRLYQESFAGPWKPGHVDFHRLGGGELRDEIFLSWLTVNYDPGRGLKYLGSLLISAGIATMFYMKAYFFGPKGAAGKGRARADAACLPDRQAAPPKTEPVARE